MKNVYFDYINNYKGINDFYNDWLNFIKNTLDINSFSYDKVNLKNDMTNYEYVYKCILMSISRRMTLLEDDFIFFEKNGDYKKIKEYNLMKKIITNPTLAPKYNSNIVGLLDDSQFFDSNGNLLVTDDFYQMYLNNYLYKGKDDYLIPVTKVFEKLSIYDGKTGTDSDMFYQLRNCLAHRDYTIEVNSFSVLKKEINVGLDNITINIDNGKIYGKLSLEDLLQVSQIFEMFSLIFSKRTFEYLHIGDSNQGLRKYNCLPRKYDPTVEYEEYEEISYPMYFKDYDSYCNLYDLSEYLGGNHFIWELLRIFNYTDITCNDKLASDKQNKMYQVIKKYCGNLWNLEQNNSEYIVLQQKNNIINRYNGILNNKTFMFDSGQRIEFFKKFFGNKIFDLETLNSISVMDYYKNPSYNIFTPCYDEFGKNRLLGFEDIATAPVLFVDFLLDQLFYNFNFVKETNSKVDGGMFKYKNIDLSDIDVYYINNQGFLEPDTPYIICSGKKSIKDLKIKIEHKISDCIKAFKIIILYNDTNCMIDDKDIQLKETLNFLNGNKQLFDLDRFISYISSILENSTDYSKEIIEKTLKMFCNRYNSGDLSNEEKQIRKVFIKKKFEKYSWIKENDLSIISYDIKKCNDYLSLDDLETCYQDSSKFMSSFRNALTHGYYQIDFTQAFSDFGKFDYDKILISFYDINPVTKCKVFEIRNISSKRLIKLLSDYSSCIISQADTKYTNDSNTENYLKDILKKCASNNNSLDADIIESFRPRI